MLTLPWTVPSPVSARSFRASPMGRPALGQCAPTRGRSLLGALLDADRWLDELLSDPCQSLESLVLREGKTERSIRMTLPLAFLAPDIVKAAVEGRLPRGYGLKQVPSVASGPNSDNWNGAWLTDLCTTPRISVC